ncbi:bestrophin family protein [Rhizobiaceae bacterium BDR2-2]|uniref:Bestrophin family protein n=1 Tax=Ectorhizobium quercum TaxID=2965071 RepID=A0AAE3N168_9HYPH|nr:bestrophin family protein [Ectorhizobium quercum]MCX8997784.1 bestrophin family protein [Ectorhizobium quercum]
MIVHPRPTLLKLFFIRRGTMLRKIWPQLLAVALMSAAIVYVHDIEPNYLPFYNNSGPFTLLGIALSIFLSFRNNACYDRWWEARKQWGDMIHVSRAVIRQTMLLSGTAEGERIRERVLKLIMAHIQAMVPHLRPSAENKALPMLEGNVLERYRTSRNPPAVILEAASADLAEAVRKGLISDISFQTIDNTITQLAHTQVACERILLTPVPFGYSLLLHRTAYIFCFLLPFGFADLLSWSTPIASALIAYTFFGLDALGDELEEPFGTEENDLPLAAMADTAGLSIREALGEKDLPPLPQPKDFLLL